MSHSEFKDCPLCGSMQISRWTVGKTVQCNACGCSAPAYNWQNRLDNQQQIDNRDYLIAEYQRQIEMLKDPVVVHMGMLRGGIAKISLENVKHLYPEVRDAFMALEEKEASLDRLNPEQG